MKAVALSLSLLGSQLLAAQAPFTPTEPDKAIPAPEFATGPAGWTTRLSAETRAKLLALDPERVTEKEIAGVLSQMPAPKILNIHGGLLPIKKRMESFTRFLVGMGYPEGSIRNPTTGDCTYGYYDSSDLIAGVIAWYYEQDGLRPMIVGHSLGGIQAIRVLHKLAGNSSKELAVWNPLTGMAEKRCEITDPLDGSKRTVVGLQVSYATAALSGGLGRILPNEWDMNGKLRKIPDSVEEFTGFQKGLDALGGDFFGSGPANNYHATGNAIVRNVRLKSLCGHSSIPDTSGFLKSPEIKDWISTYRPSNQANPAATPESKFGSKSARVVWAAEVWFSIKKHWVLELQRLVRARGSENYAH